MAELPGPDGSVRGAAHDMWQIGITSLTEPGKYIFVGPGQEVPEIEGFTSFASPPTACFWASALCPKMPKSARVC
ncbi:MAG: hypothetical protein JKP98_11975 [Rhodobacteraceae bacterium]|nr:hypothetical protein [Paracoccaceae bacterium]